MSKTLQWSVVILAMIVLVLTVQVARLPMPAPDVTVSLINKTPSVPDVVDQVIGSVVHIEMEGGGQGSGFVIAPNIIATARHCVEDVNSFKITFNCGAQVKATKAIESEKYDLGFIWVDEELPPALPLKNIRDCRLGEKVFSIGSTYGKAQFNAVAVGNIQMLFVNAEKEGLPKSYGWSQLFAMTPEGGGGNSGCPLFSMGGEVIGVWVGSRQPNVHYCVPVMLFEKDIAQLREMFIESKYKIVEVNQWQQS
jgi:S1-C subfamily serine protease